MKILSYLNCIWSLERLFWAGFIILLPLLVHCVEILAKAEQEYITQQAQVKHWTRLLRQFSILQCSVVIHAKNIFVTLWKSQIFKSCQWRRALASEKYSRWDQSAQSSRRGSTTLPGGLWLWSIQAVRWTVDKVHAKSNPVKSKSNPAQLELNPCPIQI